MSLETYSPIKHPTKVRHEIREQISNESFPISYDPERQIHIISETNLSTEAPTTVVANTGDFVMNSKGNYPLPEQRDSIFRSDDFDDGMIALGVTKPEDTLVMVDDETGYNSYLAEVVSEGFARMGIEVTSQIEKTNALSEWLKHNQPNRLSPLVISPRILEQAAISQNQAYLQGLLHVATYAKTDFERLCRENGVSTPTTHHQRLTEHNHGYVAWETHRTIQKSFDEYVISHGNGIGGSGVFFTSKNTIQETLKTHFQPGDEVMIQGRIPQLISPCVRGYLGNNGYEVIGLTKQKIRNGGTYAGNEWFEGIEDSIDQTAPNFKEVYTGALNVLQQQGVRGVVNVDILIDQQTGNSYAREVNVRPAFSHVLGVIQGRGAINGEKITQLCSTFYTKIPDELFYDPHFLDILNASSGKNMSVMPVLRYREDHNKSYLVYAANDQISPEEFDHVQHEVEKRIARYTSSS